MNFSTLILILALLWSETVAIEHRILILKPNEATEGTACLQNGPEPCETLSYYVTNQFFGETNAINLMFLQGSHYPDNFATETVEIRDKSWLVLQGSGEDTGLINYKFRLLSITNILISNIKGKGVKIDDRSYKLSNVTIRNCTFIESVLIFKAVMLHIEDSRFTGNSQSTAIKLYSSYLTFHGSVSFLSNNAISGGALSLIDSVIYYAKGNCSVDFTNNSAEEVGGAIFIDNNDECFYVMESGHPRPNSSCTLHFHNNKAKNGGDHIYGASFMSNCLNGPGKFSAEAQNANWSNLVTFEQPSSNNGDSLSAVSSTPSRVCLCDDKGKPACTDIDMIFVSIKSCPGEVIDIPVVLVGADFGTTIGSIHAGVMHENCSQTDINNRYINCRVDVYPIKQNRKCTILKYKTALSVTNGYQLMYLSTAATDTRHLSSNSLKTELQRQIVYYETHGVVKDQLRFTPIFVNISLLGCPPGFTMTSYNGTGCDCYEHLKGSISNLKCTVKDHRGYMSWNTTAWIGFDENNNLIYSKHCFPYYCRREYKKIDMGNETMLNTQCWPNRQGILCSKCAEGHSLAIGSSNCIHCPHDNNVALLIFFAGSGFLLVLFINILNLTVSQGMINGLIFYANIVWEHQSIASQREIKYTRLFLKPFIAWLNLDFGIETCFIKGLDAYKKTWLQFLFPLYIWMIAGLMITAAHYSTKITNLIGNRALHTLCTLIFLSYSKLFRIIKDILHLTVLTTVYENETVQTAKIWLWEGDESLLDSTYLGLFTFATILFLFLWVPYTLLLTCIQPLRRVSHNKCCKWINKLTPILDSYLAPLKHRHHYFFGVLLLTRGLLLMIVLVPSRGLDLHNLMIIAVLTLILIHMAINQPYRSKRVLIFQCVSFGNLIIFVAVISYLKLEDKRYRDLVLASTISVTVAFVQFCVLVVWSAVRVYHHTIKRMCACKTRQNSNDSESEAVVFDTSIDSRRESFNTSYNMQESIAVD